VTSCEGTSPVRVLLAMGDARCRQHLARALAAQAGVELVAVATSLRSALPKAVTWRPDVVVADLLDTPADLLPSLEQMRAGDGGTACLLLANERGPAPTVAADWQARGLAEVMAWPGPRTDANALALGRVLAARLVVHRQCTTLAASATPSSPPRPRLLAATAAQVAAPPAARVPARRPPLAVVGIGISTGGPKALATLLPQLPADFPLPILIVQHMPPVFTASLADSLHRACRLPVREARHGERVEPGEVLIAPGGSHLKVVRGDGAAAVRITGDPPENSCRPSVDYLFRSLSEVYGARTLAVVMTGMGSDGLAGMRLLHDDGACLVAQDHASSTVYGMPRAVANAGIVDHVAALGDIAPLLTALVGSGLAGG
jgi:two-component system chemotaxis response regulator CheB